MKVLQWLIVALAVSLIAVHGLWSDAFKVDAVSVLILFILSIPVLAQYLKRVKLAGAEFEFRDEITRTQDLVRQSVAEADRAVESGEARRLPFQTFNLSVVREFVDSDPALALGALRIEIERTLRAFSEAVAFPGGQREPLSRVIDKLRREDFLSFDQAAALKRIINMCNGAVHGARVSSDEADEIISLAGELNNSFVIGYSLNSSANDDYASQGLFCEWEHCIEWMLLRQERSEESCPVFGHDCPGGRDNVRQCAKTMGDFPKSRFVAGREAE